MPLEITHLDLTGLSYEDVDKRIHDLAGVPHDKKFVDMNARPFRGTVSKKKGSKVYDAIEFARHIFHRDKLRSEIECEFKTFRQMDFFANMIPTDKPLHGRRFNNTIIFDVSAYEDSTHNKHLEILKRLGHIWEEESDSMQLYSIIKDKHSDMFNTRDACTPFVRDHVAFLVVPLDT